MSSRQGRGCGPEDDEFAPLLAYLARVPALQQPVGHGTDDDGGWWLKFSLSLTHPLAWHVVQELAHVLNSLSLDERLPTVFKPVSPPPYLNGGPAEFLSWVVETGPGFSPALCRDWLQGRLPDPVDDEAQWRE